MKTVFLVAQAFLIPPLFTFGTCFAATSQDWYITAAVAISLPVYLTAWAAACVKNAGGMPRIPRDPQCL